MRRIATVLFMFWFVCCFTRPTFAQEGSATLTGFIQDSSKAVIPGVKVTAIETNTNQHFEATTGKDGSYSIVSLPVGPYQMQIEKPGFKTILKGDVFLHTEDALQINFQMAVGSTSESITVTGGETGDSPAISLTVNRDFIEDMPLNGRSLDDLLAMAPGATSTSPQVGGSAFSFDGQRTDANYFTVDGVAANLAPSTNTSPGSLSQGFSGTAQPQITQLLSSLDDLQEFKIQTSGYTAENGRQPGGQVQLTTRSGSNDFHGSAFDYLRNDVMDANSWEDDDQTPPLAKQKERQNDFGGTFGGPLLIPKAYNGKNRTFYFGSYEGLRLLQPSSEQTIVPTTELRNFVAPVVAQFLNSLPPPNKAGDGDQCALPETFSCTAGWFGAFSSPTKINSTNVRIDQSIGRAVSIFARYTDTSTVATITQFVPNDNPTTSNQHTWLLGGTIKLSATAVDEVRLNSTTASGSDQRKPVAEYGAVPYPVSLLVPVPYINEAPQGSLNLALPNMDQITPPAYFNVASSTHQYNAIDSLSWIVRKHSMKFGVDYRQLTSLDNLGIYQSYPDILTLGGAQSGVADITYIRSNVKVSPVFKNASVYAQDSWKITPTLTMDYGLRWEFNPAPGEASGQYPLAITTANISNLALAPSGTQVYKTKYDAFAPRFGFSYAPPLRDIAAIRGGVGLFYDTGQQLGAAGYLGYPFGDLTEYSETPFPITVAPPQSGLLPLTPPYQSITGLTDPNLALPYTISWNLSVDVDVSKRDTFTVSYVGNDGRRLLFTEQYGQDGVPLPQNPNFTQFNLTTNAAASSYNALQIQNQGQLAPGLQVLASYTYSHSIDDASSDGGGINGFSSPLRGNSDFDVRQIINAAITYNTPKVGTERVLKTLAGHWLISNRLQAQSGYPVPVFQTENQYIPATGQAQYVAPDLVAGVPLYLHGASSRLNGTPVLGDWRLNYDAFSPVPVDSNGVPLRPGTLGRNEIHGPNFWSLNSSIARDFGIHDILHAKLRLDAFNVLNHPNAGNILAYLAFGPNYFGYSYFGPSTTNASGLYAMGNARSLQVSLKLQF